eukprot:8894199-Heterocapsa_arctica.AAC.1
MDTKVNWDLNILGERPNINIQADKTWKYQKNIKYNIAEYWYRTSSKKEHMLYEHRATGQNNIPECKWHEDGIGCTTIGIQHREGRGMSYRH